MTRAATCLLDRFDLEPAWAHHPGPVRAQIGGVARAGRACPVGYRLRARSS
jgi:hypothetical protein